jgi:hypothetical protein
VQVVVTERTQLVYGIDKAAASGAAVFNVKSVRLLDSLFQPGIICLCRQAPTVHRIAIELINSWSSSIPNHSSSSASVSHVPYCILSKSTWEQERSHVIDRQVRSCFGFGGLGKGGFHDS